MLFRSSLNSAELQRAKPSGSNLIIKTLKIEFKFQISNFKFAMKGNIVAGLDIGSHSIKALAVQKKQKDWEVLSYAEIPSFGLRKGAVENTGVEEV